MKPVLELDAVVKAAQRREHQTRRRLQAVIAGGYRPFEPNNRLIGQTSTRGERRRAKLGRA